MNVYHFCYFHFLFSSFSYLFYCVSAQRFFPTKDKEIRSVALASTLAGNLGRCSHKVAPMLCIPFCWHRGCTSRIIHSSKWTLSGLAHLMPDTGTGDIDSLRHMKLAAYYKKSCIYETSCLLTCTSANDHQPLLEFNSFWWDLAWVIWRQWKSLCAVWCLFWFSFSLLLLWQQSRPKSSIGEKTCQRWLASGIGLKAKWRDPLFDDLQTQTDAISAPFLTNNAINGFSSWPYFEGTNQRKVPNQWTQRSFRFNFDHITLARIYVCFSAKSNRFGTKKESFKHEFQYAGILWITENVNSNSLHTRHLLSGSSTSSHKKRWHNKTLTDTGQICNQAYDKRREGLFNK